MKLLFDFLPIILFFVAYKTADIYVATMVAMIVSALQVLVYRVKFKKFDNMQLVTLALITVLGGLTLILQDERFIKWKPTMVNWAFAVALLGYGWYIKAPVIEKLLGKQIKLPLPVWYKLDYSWALFFGFSGALNLWVAFEFSTDTWVNFKLYGSIGLTLAFIALQALYLSRHLTETPETTLAKEAQEKEEDA